MGSIPIARSITHDSIGPAHLNCPESSLEMAIFGPQMDPSDWGEPRSDHCNELMLLAGVVTVVELSRVERKAALE